jgi:hypothetical protein
MKDGAPAHGHLPTVFPPLSEATRCPTDRALHERIQLPDEVVLRRGAPDLLVLQGFLEGLQHPFSLDPLLRLLADRKYAISSGDMTLDERGVRTRVGYG